MTYSKVKELYGITLKIDAYNEFLETLNEFYKGGDAKGLELFNDPGDGVTDYLFSIESVPGLLESMIAFITKERDELQKLLDDA